MAIKFDFKFKNTNTLIRHLERMQKTLEQQVEEAFLESAKTIETNAKKTIIRNNNIITGRLLRSITGDVKTRKKYGYKTNFTLRAYSRVFYAIYVERRYPYLFPAYEQERPRLMKKLKKILDR
jgi:hypothetical protein